MARILIGNIKGPKGDTGARGATGPQGPAGPQGPLPPLTNNALATTPGVSALDAVMGKTLQDQITKQNSDLGLQYDTVIATKDVSNNTVTTVCNKWLAKGVYVVNANLRLVLPTQTTIEQTLTIGGTADGRGSSALTLPAGTQAFTHTSVITVNDDSSNVVLQARHYAGVTVSVTGWLSITKIK